MKSFYYLLITGIICITICLAFTITNNGDRTQVKITETLSLFKLEASYNRDQTKKVKAFINQTLKPVTIFNTSDELDTRVTLGDSSNFYIRASAGWLLVKVDKDTNSAASLLRLKNLCQQLSKNVIK
jgi:hypothetical protein